MPDSNVSLREYVDIRVDALEKAFTISLANQDRAVSKAEVAAEKRFDSVNEFRSALSDSSRLLMPRSESEQITKGMEEKINVLTERLNARDERGRGSSQVWIAIAAVIAAITSMLTVYVIGKH